MINWSIGDIAARAGIRPSAIRYYESAGVLPEPRRVNGRRRYTPEALSRLTVIKMAQEAGFTIAEIKTLFDGFEPATAASARWRTLAERKIAEIDALIARAEKMRHVLDQSLRCECVTLDECGLIGWPPCNEPAGAWRNDRPKHIDNHLSLWYDAAMSTRTRPSGCCERPNNPVQLPATEQERLVGMFKALSDPTRFDIFRLVAAQDAPICACDVVDRFQVSQPTISHHMKVLRDAGLVTVSRRGVWAYYAADPRGLALLRASLDSFAPSPLLATG